LEGCDDPGRVFVRRQNIRFILCALSLLQLQGCDETLETGWSIIVTTMVIGFLMILPLMFSIFSSFWTSASTASDASTSTPLHVPTLQGTSIVGPSVFDQVDGESTPNEALMQLELLVQPPALICLLQALMQLMRLVCRFSRPLQICHFQVKLGHLKQC
jgi:hypothetical protein